MGHLYQALPSTYIRINLAIIIRRIALFRRRRWERHVLTVNFLSLENILRRGSRGVKNIPTSDMVNAKWRIGISSRVLKKSE